MPHTEVYAEALRLDGYTAKNDVPHVQTVSLVVTRMLLSFLAERMKVTLREKGIRHDLIDAVLSIGKPNGVGEDNLVRLIKRVDALQTFLNTDDGVNLLAAYKRAANIVRIESKKDGVDKYDLSPQTEYLEQLEEQTLFGALEVAHDHVEPMIVREDFAAAMKVLSELRKPVDNFFDRVTVNVAENEALRLNRLKLLAKLVDVINLVADFSKIEG